MSGKRLEWAAVQRYFTHRNYVIYPAGGDKIIAAPKDGDPRRRRQTVRIGHNFCTRANDELLPTHVTRIKLAFNVTKQMILDDNA